ncbi:MAG: DUF1365 domain-containing protein [Pseudomonadota bacterium]|nr:DUF1365 domain-containing protein [Pseudomonadota bacterium]
MTAFASGFYAGVVTHQRLRPKAHHLRYSMFQMLFDLDELPRLAGALGLFSHNRFNLFSFFDRDHGDGRAGPLRAYVEETLAEAGIDLGGGRIALLCMPRLFGHVFNPLSIYYCHRADGSLAAMLYEVNNTFGERHSYLIAAPPSGPGPIRQSCPKAFHVSPFMDMAMTYDFAVTTPAESLTTTVNASDAAGALVIVAAFSGRRRELTDRVLFRALFAYPLLTLKVVAAIHLEAMKLILKGVRLRPRPPAPAHAVSVG